MTADRDNEEVDSRQARMVPVRYVGGLLVRLGKLLLGRRNPRRASYPGAWDLFGGHVEPGETFERALHRELEEELGIAPVRFSEIACHIAHDIEYRIFRVDEWSGGEPAIRNDEHTQLGWFTVAESIELRPLASERYRELFAGINTTEAGLADPAK